MVSCMILISAVTIGFERTSFDGTEGDSIPFQICALMVEGSLERLVPIYVTTQRAAATASGNDLS